MQTDAPTPGPDETPDPAVPDATTAHLDPSGLKDALGRTGRMLKSAGLPFEEDEFDEETGSSDSDEVSNDPSDSVPAPMEPDEH